MKQEIRKDNKINKKGFTLVELLVVVAIIGILAAIVLVSLNSARDRARKASLQATMASITTMANLCVNDGGTVNTPSAPGTTTICSNSTITPEVYPNFSLIQGLETSGYVYSGTNVPSTSGQIIATNGTAPVVTCTISTGSCVLN